MLPCVINYEDIPPLLPALSSSVLSIVAIVVILIVVVVIVMLVVLFLLNVPAADMLGFLVAMLRGGRWGVAVTFLGQANPKEIDRGVVGSAYICVALLRQLHPAVREGVVLVLLDSVAVRDLVLHGVGVDCFVGGPRAMLVEADHLRGPPIVTPCVGDHLVALHHLHHNAVGDNAAVACGELATHHTTEVLLRGAPPVHGLLPCDQHSILGKQETRRA